MTRLAKELGISDVGLAKACRRHGIPVPPRGHWAKLAAAKPSPQISLPSPDQDTPVQLTLTDPVKRQETQVAAEAKKAAIEARRKSLPAVDMGTASKPHPLVKATLAYLARIPALVRRYERLSPMERLSRDIERPPHLDKGRRHIHVPNGLVLTVSDESAEWAIAAHDRLINSLIPMGCRFSIDSRRDNEPAGLACELASEKIYFTFSEGYRKQELTTDEQSAAKKRGGWSNDWEWRPSGRFTWAVRGTEYSIGHHWSGKRTDIEAKLPDIVAACLEFLEKQPSVRETRLSEEAKRRQEAEDREKRQRTEAARREQLDHALEIAQLYEKELSLKGFLDHIESRRAQFTVAFQPKLNAWIKVVRDELDQNPPHIRKLADTILQPYLSADGCGSLAIQI